MKTFRFDELNLSKEILKAVTDMGFEEATPIQSTSIPVIMKGKDIVGLAQTGTGKTASFGIPIIEFIEYENKNIQALVLCPTRELAVQVAEELNRLLKYKKNLKAIPVYGGQSIDRQIKALKTNAQIIIATPGRLLDHIKRKTINISHIKFVVLDEADEMLNMGFREDIEEILKSVPDERQTIMFSATMPKAITELSKKYLNHPEYIKVIHDELTVPNVKQFYIELKNDMKLEVLTRLIDIYDPKLSLVFCNTKRMVDELTSHLQARGYSADSLHGDMKQMMRDRVMSKFRKGTLDVLIATDVAARGIDVEEIDAVFNYDLPQDEEYYVHRIGRTARAGRMGKAFTFVSGKDFKKIRDIERYTKKKIVRQSIPTLKDVEEVRTNAMIEDIKEVLKNGDETKKYMYIVENLLQENYMPEEIASGLIKMLISQNKENVIPEVIYSQDFKEKSFSGKHSGMRSKHKSSGNDPRFLSNEKISRLFINIGKKSKIKPGDILGAIAGETGIPGNTIGEIALYDNYCFVDVPEKFSDKIIKTMNKSNIRGNKVKVQRASEK